MITDILESIEYKGYTIQIVLDDDLLDPIQDHDMLGTQAYWHNRRNLGHDFKATSRMNPEEYMLSILNHEQQENNDFENIPEGKIREMFNRSHLVIPVFAYEHGGITIKAEENGIGWDNWDSGQLGFVYVSKSKIKQEYGNLRKSTIEKVKKILIAEVQEYDDYLTGNGYGFQVLKDGEELDSCYGYLGHDGKEQAESDAQGYIDWQVKEDAKELFCYDQRMTLGYSEA